ncbi:MAG: thiol protease/hemagglutinin PrtT [Candidatus Sabulitectum sp.]|nr:thiol protease/hemagglutinin PrtT [Candidatus Sabulitectum sp.]
MRLFLSIIAITTTLLAFPVSFSTAETAAESRLIRDGEADSRTIGSCFSIENDNSAHPLAYVFELLPCGYIITSADDYLPPVIAYSYTSSCKNTGEESSILLDIVRSDLELRLHALDRIPPEYKTMNNILWEEYINGLLPGTLLEQWPPEGSTPTEGWLEENWTQGPPFNNYCPMDLIAGARSAAGCPAVAMAMILNFHEITNGTRFNDDDDYYHNYHEYYWIDDDCVAHDFPSWPELNVYLDTLDSHYANEIPITSSDKAVIVYASGAACKQVYTAAGSGTFGVTQAYNAYQRFAFAESELLHSTSDSLYERLSGNMMEALPAHLAIIDSASMYGHNVVVDGYNTDEFYHINFGWGGSYNGWYLFPLTGMPYGMNLIEGIVLDIAETAQSIEEGDSESAGNPLAISCISNPVSGSLQVILSTECGCRVNLSVYTLTGRLVKTVVDAEFIPGSHSINWTPENASSGIYLLRASSPTGTDTAKFTLVN